MVASRRKDAKDIEAQPPAPWPLASVPVRLFLRDSPARGLMRAHQPLARIVMPD